MSSVLSGYKFQSSKEFNFQANAARRELMTEEPKSFFVPVGTLCTAGEFADNFADDFSNNFVHLETGLNTPLNLRFVVHFI